MLARTRTAAAPPADGSSPADAGRRAGSAARRGLLIAALFVALIGLLGGSERDRGVTADEPLHLTRGLAYWWSGDTRLSYAHPPLANALQGLAATVGHEPVDLTELKGWWSGEVPEVARAYFAADFARARAQLTAARRATMAMTCALGVWLLAFGWRHYGFPTAAVALALFVFNPTVLAHGRLATTDLPAALVICGAVFSLWEFLQRPGWRSVAAFVVSAAALVATKHSGGPLLLWMGLVAAAWAIAGAGRFAGKGLGQRVAGLGLAYLAVTLAVLLAVNGVYRFQRVGYSAGEMIAAVEPKSWLSSRRNGKLLDADSPIGKLPPALRIPLPFTYVVGLATVRAQNRQGHGNFFFVRSRPRGRLAYFPLLLAIKTPVGTLGLWAAAVAVAVGRLRARASSGGPARLSWFLAGAVALYLGLAMTSRINIGVRHVLPVIPLLCLLGGRAAVVLWARGGRALRAAVGACVLATAAATVAAFPRYLGYFNGAIGGPAVGLRISVIGEDWGQDTIRTAAFVREHGLVPLHYYARFPIRMRELQHHGVDVRELRCGAPPAQPGWVAIHRSELVRRVDRCFAWLDVERPYAVVDHHVFLWPWGFEVDGPPPPRVRLDMRWRWPWTPVEPAGAAGEADDDVDADEGAVPELDRKGRDSDGPSTTPALESSAGGEPPPPAALRFVPAVERASPAPAPSAAAEAGGVRSPAGLGEPHRTPAASGAAAAGDRGE